MSFLSGLISSKKVGAGRSAVSFEALEQRELFASAPPTITGMTADNRGEVLLSVSKALVASTVNSSSVTMYTPGKDRRIGTKDDVKVKASVSYSKSKNRITVEGNLAANTLYRIKLDAKKIYADGKVFLDGEFSGKFHSGNGKAGGNFEARVAVDTSGAPTVRMQTTDGVVSIRIFQKQKPITAGAFLSYVNHGYYDGMFFSRNEKGFILQGGSVKVTADNKITTNPAGKAIRNEFTDNGIIHNTVGTLALAKEGGNPNPDSSEFFFNLADNRGTPPMGLDYQNGGFTVFAKVSDSASLAVLNKISAAQTAALHNDFTGNGILPKVNHVDLVDVPLRDLTRLSGRYEQTSPQGAVGPVVLGNLNPLKDLFIINRTAVLMKVGKV